MPASWSRSYTLGIKQKAFSWRIDRRGNLFIKRKLRRPLFPRIDKISCSHLERLCMFIQDMEWKDLANDASNYIWELKRTASENFCIGSGLKFSMLNSQAIWELFFTTLRSGNGTGIKGE